MTSILSWWSMTLQIWYCLILLDLWIGSKIGVNCFLSIYMIFEYSLQFYPCFPLPWFAVKCFTCLQHMHQSCPRKWNYRSWISKCKSVSCWRNLSENEFVLNCFNPLLGMIWTLLEVGPIIHQPVSEALLTQTYILMWHFYPMCTPFLLFAMQQFFISLFCLFIPMLRKFHFCVNVL